MKPTDYQVATNFKLRMIKKDILVSVVCLVMAAIGCYFLYLDINDLGELGSGQALGQVEKCEAEVKRRAATSFSWAHVTPDERLFLKDTIQTGPDSAVVIHLTSGDLLELGENSLIVMDNSESLPLQFLRGSAVLKSEKSEKRLNVDADGKADVQELPIRLLQPAFLAREFIQGEGMRSIPFSWAQSKATLEEGSTLQVSPDKTFPPPLTQSFNSPAHQNSLNLSPGRYYWRVLLNSSLRTSAVRKLWVSRVDPPLLIWPSSDQSIEDTSDDESTQMRWVNVKAQEDFYPERTPQTHALELARDVDFAKIEMSLKIDLTNGLARVRHLANGKWYWRIRSDYDKRFTIYTEIRSFDFLWTPKEVPIAPVKMGQQESQSSAPFLSSSPGLSPIPLPAPSWVVPSSGPLPESSPSPFVEPSSSPAPTSASIPSATASPSAVPLLPPPHPLVAAGARVIITDEPTQRDLAWNTVPGAKRYQVTIYKKSPQTKKWGIHSQKVTANSKLPIQGLEVGEYSWTIRAQDGQNNWGKSTSLRSFLITYEEPLDAPVVVSPEVQ